jgi:branched-chain amino acid transport system substrate-binding protein
MKTFKLTSATIGLAAIFMAVAIFGLNCQTQQGIKIGVLLPLTGNAANLGNSARRGIELAVDEINGEGGINSKKVTVYYVDDQDDPAQAAAAMTKLIKEQKVPSVIGSISSFVTIAIAPIADQNKVVLLSPASEDPKISGLGDYLFRNCYTEDYEAKQMARFIGTDIKAKKIGIMYVNTNYGAELAQAFTDNFTKLGGKVVDAEIFDSGATDFQAQLNNIKKLKPDGEYIIGFRRLGMLLAQAKALGLSGPFYSSMTFEDSTIIKTAGKAANGVIYTYPAYNPASKDEQVVDFVNFFQKKYDMIPDIYAANSYDAMKILALAIQQAGTKAEKIKEALYTMKDYPGVTGLTSFDLNGDAVKPVAIKQVVNGKFTFLRTTY